MDACYDAAELAWRDLPAAICPDVPRSVPSRRLTSTDTGSQDLPNPNGEATADPSGQAIASVRAHVTEVCQRDTWVRR